MAVREHEDKYSRNYYWSSFNPHKIFSTLESAENYELLYYVQHFKNIHFYRTEEDMKEGKNEIKFDYEPNLEYQYYASLGGLQERQTVEPTFKIISTDQSNGKEKSLYYFYDMAKFLEIDARTDERIPQIQKIKNMNKIINTLNKFWKLGIPFDTGKYKYSKKEGWIRLS